MADTSLNLFDLGVLIIVGLSALLSFYRGFFSEMLSLVSWGAAAYITLRFLPMGSKMLAPHIKSVELCNGVAAVGIFLIALVVISIAMGMLFKFIKPATKVGVLDNLLGLCFGIARGVLIVAIAYFVLSVVMVEKDFPQVVKQAKSRPFVAKASHYVAKLAPSYLDELSAPKAKTDKEKATDDSSDDAPKIIRLNGDGVSTTPTLEDLQKRIHEENEKNDVR